MLDIGFLITLDLIKIELLICSWKHFSLFGQAIQHYVALKIFNRI